MFLNVSAPKLLLLAGVDRLDKELMVGQMQGRFGMQVLPQCGHAVHGLNFRINRINLNYYLKTCFVVYKYRGFT